MVWPIRSTGHRGTFNLESIGLTPQARNALVELRLLGGCHPFSRRPRVRHRPLALRRCLLPAKAAAGRCPEAAA